MFCMKCGNNLPDDSKFCSNCGAQVQVGYSEPIVEQPKEKKKEAAYKVPLFGIGFIMLLIFIGFLILTAVSEIKYGEKGTTSWEEFTITAYVKNQKLTVDYKNDSSNTMLMGYMDSTVTITYEDGSEESKQLLCTEIPAGETKQSTFSLGQSQKVETIRFSDAYLYQESALEIGCFGDSFYVDIGEDTTLSGEPTYVNSLEFLGGMLSDFFKDSGE